MDSSDECIPWNDIETYSDMKRALSENRLKLQRCFDEASGKDITVIAIIQQEPDGSITHKAIGQLL